MQQDKHLQRCFTLHELWELREPCEEWTGADGQSWWYAQAQGIEAVAPDLLSARPEYPLQVEMTPLPPKKRSKNAEGAAQGDLSAQPGAVQEQATAQPSAVQDDFIAL